MLDFRQSAKTDELIEILVDDHRDVKHDA